MILRAEAELGDKLDDVLITTMKLIQVYSYKEILVIFNDVEIKVRFEDTIEDLRKQYYKFFNVEQA